MTHQNPSILNTYQHRHVLLTGATGFLGKVIFAMMLDRLPTIGYIYVLIRRGKKQSAIERFTQEILSSPVFTQLTVEKQTELHRFLTAHVKVLEGDISLPQLGLSNDIANYLYSKIDLVFHVAGLVDFFPDVRTGLDINVNGALHVAEFVKHSQHARLLHISTCYVAGNQSGFFSEELILGKSPNGLPFDVESELATLTKEIALITGDLSSSIGKKGLSHRFASV